MVTALHSNSYLRSRVTHTLSVCPTVAIAYTVEIRSPLLKNPQKQDSVICKYILSIYIIVIIV